MESVRRQKSKGHVSKHVLSVEACSHDTSKLSSRAPQILTILREIEGQTHSSRSVRNSRKASRFLRSLVLSTSYTFQPIAEIRSRRSLHYEQNRIYSQNLHSVFSVGCFFISQKRNFLSSPFVHNVEEYIYVQAPIGQNCVNCIKNHCCQPSALVLSTVNDLRKLVVIHFSATKGYVKHFILDADRNYKSAKMDWNVAYESFFVSLHQKCQRLFKVFLFSVFPLSYKGCLTINKNLGCRPTDLIKLATLSLDMLVLHTGRDTVSLYNIHGSLSTLSSYIEINSFADLPAPLLVVNKCDGFSMQMGGFPYVLLTGATHGGHNIRTLNGETIGVLKPIDSRSIFFKDITMFSETESGHIIQKGEHSIRIFKTPEESSMCKQLQPAFPAVSFDFSPPVEHRTVSTYGRTLSRINNSDEGYGKLPTILCNLDLEDELDLFYTLTCDYLAEPPQVYVNLLDSATMEVLKTSQLDFTFSQSENSDDEALQNAGVSADRDLLIVHSKFHNKHFLRLYQLSHKSRLAGLSCKVQHYQFT
ncbi:uncharacterized protein [Watersipora subatra]|uniref:uncharacterized protein n=1 Tax=Watersipora subatra TaxID=2589382 RepID=UPI00355B38BC